MRLRYFVFAVLLGLILSTLHAEAKSVKGKQPKKSHHGKLLKALIGVQKDDSKKLNDPAEEEAPAEEAPAEEGAKEAPKEGEAAAEEGSAGSGGGESGAESGSGEGGTPPPTEPAKPPPCTGPSCPQLPFKVVGPLGGHPHPGPPSALNPCPQPRYCDPARCKDPIGCAPACSDACCADILVPPPTPAPSPGAPQPVFPPVGPQPGYAAPAGSQMPGPFMQAPPASCDQGCYATNCAPPCPPQCCYKKKSSIHSRKSRSITTSFAMCH